jgi:hypothetical protein
MLSVIQIVRRPRGGYEQAALCVRGPKIAVPMNSR